MSFPLLSSILAAIVHSFQISWKFLCDVIHFRLIWICKRDLFLALHHFSWFCALIIADLITSSYKSHVIFSLVCHVPLQCLNDFWFNYNKSRPSQIVANFFQIQLITTARCEKESPYLLTVQTLVNNWVLCKASSFEKTQLQRSLLDINFKTFWLIKAG